MISYTEALIMVAEYHKDQKDKSGIEYIKHPLTVSMKLKDKGYSEIYQIAGLFHDVLEDCNLTYEQTDEFKTKIDNDDLFKAIKLLTHDDESRKNGVKKLTKEGMEYSKAVETEYLEYIQDIKMFEGMLPYDIAIAVKICDLEHNSDIRRVVLIDKESDDKSGRRLIKYAKAIRILEK